MRKQPQIFEFPKLGNRSNGYISPAEKENLPFVVKRIYWTYFTPESIQRGGHAHYELEQILIAAAGTIVVKTEMPNGFKKEFVLDSPDKAVFLPKMSWHIMLYSHDSVQMCIASLPYDEKDYIRNYDVFKNVEASNK